MQVTILQSFGDHSHSGGGVIKILDCHVIQQDYVIKGSCDFMVGSPTHHAAKFGGHKDCGSGDISSG